MREWEWGRLKVVRRDLKNLWSPPFVRIYIRWEYINLIIEISIIDELVLF
jgi:hypothetical protein